MVNINGISKFFISIVTLLFVYVSVAEAVPRAFTQRFSTNLQGNMKMIGNTVLGPSNNTFNSNTNLLYVDVDGVAGTFNSSSATLQDSDIINSAQSRVVWAGLYWQGYLHKWDTGNGEGGSNNTPYRGGNWQSNTNATVRNQINSTITNQQIVFRTPSGVFNVRPDQIDTQDNGQGINNYPTTSYSCFANVTALIQNQSPLGQYTVANIPAQEGMTSGGTYSDGLGNYGAWALVVVYANDSDPSQKVRNITVFDGHQIVANATNPAVNILLSGFQTPRNGLVDSRVSVFAAEGDRSIGGDRLRFTNEVGVQQELSVVGGGVIGNFFNSSIVGVPTRNPVNANNQGIDIQTVQVGSADSGPGLINNNHTSATITLSSTIDANGNADTYFPSTVVFTTELYKPQLCYDYSFKQDNQYLNTNNDGTDGVLPLLTGTINDSPIEVSIYVRNKEADIKIEGVSFYTDLNSTLFNYVNGSTATTSINGTGYVSRNDSFGGCSYGSTSTSTVACNDGHNVRIGLGDGASGFGQTTAGDLDSQEFVYAKFEIDPTFTGIRDMSESLGLKLDYYIQPDPSADPSVRNYTFGTHIDLCPPSSGYTPTWGTFNVVDRNASNIGNIPINNLRTQVSRKPFYADVVTYEKNIDGTYTKVPTIDINTTVLVEIIDNDAFHDANASCANPGSALTEPIYVRIQDTSHNMRIPIAEQNEAYHNFAVKNAAYRIWYFDKNESAINWTAVTPDTTRRTLSSIGGLYQSGYHTLCSASCASPTSTTCFQCIKTNYAKPLCSRDNFAVRPESYDLRIFDIDQNATETQKDATKIDLSNEYQYAPMYNAPLSRMNVAAGYNYRYDMNATGHDTNLSKVPGYTRYFNGASSDYNATMIWDPEIGHITTGCNDTTGKNLSFYVANGQMLNREQNQTQVGEYRLNVIDQTWTAVDWDASRMNHHNVNPGFQTGLDCQFPDTFTETDSNGKIGCVITSDHMGGGYNYKDHLLRLKPAKFDLSGINYGLGVLANSIASGGEGYVYKSDLGVINDMAMSVRAFGPIKAVGYNGEVLSNFVKECYSVDLNLSISHDANISEQFNARMTVADGNTTQMYDSLKLDANNTANTIIDDAYFAKNDQGTTYPTVRLNFDRNATTETNPQLVHYGDFNVSCSMSVDCNMSAAYSYTPNTAFGNDILDFNVTHLYGRAVPQDVKVMGGLLPFDVPIKYEVYGATSLFGQSLLSDSAAPGWSINRFHNEANDGNATITVIYPTAGSQNYSSRVYDNNGTVMTHYPAFTTRQGYQGHVDTEGWLWYGGVNALSYLDPANPGNLSCFTHPCFNISFGRIIGNTGSAKEESEGHKANKNTKSGTGWGTTREYAPSTR